jgi:hypothetical protein
MLREAYFGEGCFSFLPMQASIFAILIISFLTGVVAAANELLM